MSVHSEDIAFAYLPGSVLEFPSSATNNSLYRFEYSGIRYVMKELDPDSPYWQLGKNAVEVAGVMNTAYKIVKRYYRDTLLDTSYLVMKSRESKPTVVTLQREIKGKSLWQEVREGDGHDVVRCNKIVEKFRKIWNKSVLHDHNWQTLFHANRSFISPDIDLQQIIHTPDDRYILVDF